MPNRNVLAEHHHHLDRVFEALVVRAQAGDLLTLRSEWSLFEQELLCHMALEEDRILPRFRHHHPAEAAAILAEHDQIRAALVEMGVRLDLHLLDACAVREFVERLRALARREEQVLYPAAHRLLDPGEWNRLQRALGESAAVPGAVDGRPAIT